MANKPPKGQETPFRNNFTTAAKGQKELRVALKQELDERLSAKNILNPDEVAGDYDFKRALMTTLDGQLRMITMDDLRRFGSLTNQLKQKFKGGITAKQIIDLSAAGVNPNQEKTDRDRARDEIHTAMPITNRGGRVQFQTNAGPKSRVTRHHVVVEFMDYNAAAASPLPPDKIAKVMTKGKIKVECSCERWRYWFRFIATAGRYQAGRPETGFPKIRNPNLKGVACKHIVKVAALINQSPTFLQYAARMIEHGRRTLDGKRKIESIKAMEQFAAEAKKEGYRQRRIATSEEKRAERARWKSSKPVADLKAKAAAKARAKAEREAKTAMKAVEANIQKLLALGAIDQATAKSMLAGLKKG